MTTREVFNEKRNVTRAYQVKLESSTYDVNGTSTGKLWQEQMLGKIDFTASGERSITYENNIGEVLYANASLIGYSANKAYVMTVTTTAITIYSEISGTVYWSVIGSDS